MLLNGVTLTFFLLSSLIFPLRRWKQRPFYLFRLIFSSIMTRKLLTRKTLFGYHNLCEIETWGPPRQTFKFPAPHQPDPNLNKTFQLQVLHAWKCEPCTKCPIIMQPWVDIRLSSSCLTQISTKHMILILISSVCIERCASLKRPNDYVQQRQIWRVSSPWSRQNPLLHSSLYRSLCYGPSRTSKSLEPLETQ